MIEYHNIFLYSRFDVRLMNYLVTVVCCVEITRQTNLKKQTFRQDDLTSSVCS